MTSSIGVPLPGTFEYALASIAALSRDPQVATGAIALANVAAVGGTPLFGWRRFSPLAGIIAGLAYAASPWAVFFSRKVCDTSESDSDSPRSPRFRTSCTTSRRSGAL